MSEPRGAGTALMVNGVAGAPRPTGTGTHTNSTTPIKTATAVAAPPSARLARGERRIGAANRSGFSMKRTVSTASPADINTAASANHRVWPSTGATDQIAASSRGQCHRYHEYEIRPIARIGDNPRTRPHPCDDVAQPAPITSTAPSVGHNAAIPG